jgi:hypothetical protein
MSEISPIYHGTVLPSGWNYMPENFAVVITLAPERCFVNACRKSPLPMPGEPSDSTMRWLCLVLRSADVQARALPPSGVGEFVCFVNGVEQDRKAVEAAFEHEWSQGQVEGQVNRLKLLKRQMYGRAKFDLLRARVLHQG